MTTTTDLPETGDDGLTTPSRQYVEDAIRRTHDGTAQTVTMDWKPTSAGIGPDPIAAELAPTPDPADVDTDEEATCPNCGRDHIPDENEGTTCVECLDGRGEDEF